LYCKDGEPPLAYISGEKPHFIECTDYPDQTAEMARIIRENPEKSIGIICGSKKSQEATYLSLRDELPRSIRVQSSQNTINFDLPGVKILNYANMKGLEFDIVILPRIEKIYSSKDRVIDMNRMYVAISRAVDELYIFYFDTKIGRSYANVIQPILDNPDVVSWWEIK
jgi:DNA helicase IV